MAQLKTTEKRYFENLFNMESGYVLDFSNHEFARLINDTVGLNIYDSKYEYIGNSKAKRLRAFWALETDFIVGIVLSEMLEVWKFEELIKSEIISNEFYIECKKIVNRLLGNQRVERTEEDFLNIKFDEINLSFLELDFPYENIINQRIKEIKTCLSSDASLSVVFLCGSTLEGLLIEKASKYIRDFNSAKSAPKDKNGKVKQLSDWTLSSLIDVAYELNFIELDIKRFSHELRDFRNYIHPRVQVNQNFSPDKHTAQICWQILQASISSLSGLRKFENSGDRIRGTWY